MRRLILILVLIAVGGLMFRGTVMPRRARAAINIVVAEDGLRCTTPEPLDTADWLTIHEAVDSAVAGQTIFVCAGDYTEPILMLDQQDVALLGPGSTPENDGIATVYIAANADRAVSITGATAALSGFTIDASTSQILSAYGVTVAANDVTISHNVIKNTTDIGLFALNSDNITADHNSFQGSAGYLVYCGCTHANFSDNTFTSTNGLESWFQGDNISFRRNQVHQAPLVIDSNDGMIEGNAIYSSGLLHIAVDAAGDLIDISNNQFIGGELGWDVLFIGVNDSGLNDTPTNARIFGNTFTNVPDGIRILNPQPGVTATVGGSPSNANVFTNSGVALGDSHYLLYTYPQITATYNDWGLCTEEDIRLEVNFNADISDFIAPAGCPTGTPGPTSALVLTQGNLDCDNEIGSQDAIVLFLALADFEPSQNEPCPEIGGDVQDAGIATHPWGDLNCDNAIDTNDGILLLTYLASMVYEQDEPCQDMLDFVVVGGG